MRNVFLISVIVLLILPINVYAQFQRSLYFTAGFGGTSYRGDLSNHFQSWGGTFHAGLTFNKKKRLNGYLHLMIGGVRGNNDSYTYNSTETTTPNTYFKTSLISVGYELRINILKKESFAVYVSPGIALLRFEPKDEFNDSYSNQFSTRAKGEEYSTVSLMLPLKIGGSYYLTNGYGIGMDLGFLNPLTDYIDNISQWGNRSKKDNLLQMNLLLYIPIK